MDQIRRKNVSVMQTETVGLQSIAGPKGRQIRDAAEKIERVFSRIAVELIFEECFVRRRKSAIESEPKRVSGRTELSYGAIILNACPRHIRTRVKRCQSNTYRIKLAGRNAVSRKGKSCFRIENRIGQRRK